MRVSAMVLMLFFSGAGAAAQATAGSTAAVFTEPPASESCPVNFSVERKSNSGLVAVDRGDEAYGQGLRVNLDRAPSNVLTDDSRWHDSGCVASAPQRRRDGDVRVERERRSGAGSLLGVDEEDDCGDVGGVDAAGVFERNDVADVTGVAMQRGAEFAGAGGGGAVMPRVLDSDVRVFSLATVENDALQMPQCCRLRHRCSHYRC